MKFISIRDKFVSLIFKLLLTVVCLVSAGSFVISTLSINNSFDIVEDKIIKAMIQQGQTLASNSSIALTGMVEDNAFTSINELVSSTVKSNDAIIMGVFVDSQLVIWASAGLLSKTETVTAGETVNDAQSLWAHSLQKTDYVEFEKAGKLLIEFASPVFSENDRLGTVRFTLTTDALNKEINISRENIESSSYYYFLFILTLASIAIFFGIQRGKQQA